MRQTIDAKGFREGPCGLRRLEGLDEMNVPEVVTLKKERGRVYVRGCILTL